MTFLDKYELLKKSIPVPAVIISSSTDCEYVDGAYGCKNCYFCYRLAGAEDCIYSNGIFGTNIVDSIFVLESEKCYQCVDCNKCYNCTYLMNCNNCTECHFSVFLNNCSDCIGCAGLSSKKYCILNNQLSKDQYEKALNSIKNELGCK